MFLKHLKKKPSTKNIISSTNTINISIIPSSNSRKYTFNVKKHNNYKTPDSTLIKINKSTNTTNSFINYKNKNNENYKNYEINDINDINYATIHSNGKFNNIKQLRNNIRKRLFEKNIILSNNFINNKLNKNLSMKFSLSKNNNSKWKGLNISSHYLGNTIDNRFGVTTNKICVNKNIILTSSHDNLKPKQNYDKTSIIIERYTPTKKKEFKCINIPNHDSYFNGIGTTNFFPRIKNVINNENLYKKLMAQMTLVFNNKIKEYSLHKSNEKNSNASTQTNNECFRKTLKNIKQQKLFNYDYKEFKKNRKNFSPIFVRNDSLFFNNEKKYKTKNEENKNIYKAIYIKYGYNKNIVTNFDLNQNNKDISN